MATAPMTWWWLSFCDEARPEGQQFLGVAVVRATSHVDAMRVAWARGCNPGGQCMGLTTPFEVGDPPVEMQHRLMTDKAEISRLERAWHGQRSTGCVTVGQLEDAGTHDVDAMAAQTIVPATKNEGD